MRLNNLFGTSGVRGLTDKEINEEFCFNLGLAFGKFLGEGKVAVGRDNRPKADKMLRAAKKGLVKAGLEVKDFGILPSPELSFHLVRIKAVGGMMVTGSHLPIGMLGVIPLLKDGTIVFGKVGQKITEIYEKIS